MPIDIRCDGCDSKIRVDDSLAGRSGTCRHCGSSLTIPRPEDLAPRTKLADATPEGIIDELRRRGRRAVLILLDGDQSSPVAGDQAAPVQLTAIGAEAFNQEQLANVYKRLAKAALQRADTIKRLAEEAEQDVFELKGDQLGMTLSDFKQKYSRRVPSLDRVAPYCSDEFPGQKIPDLATEAWHSAAGIVHARTDLPEENASPTIAGVATSLVLYQFLDGKLFQVSACFDPDAYHVVKAALSKKFGATMESEGATRSAQWWSMASTINLQAGSLRPRQPTLLSFRHDGLLREASKRQPDATADL